MGYKELLREENEGVAERYDLAISRIKTFLQDKDTAIEEPFLDYFTRVSTFLLEMDQLKQYVDTEKKKEASFEEMRKYNQSLYADILPGKKGYDVSYANPVYAVQQLGEEYGPLLSFLYTELRGDIIYAVEQRHVDLTIHAELLVEILCLFEEGIPEVGEIKEVLYYFVSDYADYTIDYRTREILDPQLDLQRRLFVIVI